MSESSTEYNSPYFQKYINRSEIPIIIYICENDKTEAIAASNGFLRLCDPGLGREEILNLLTANAFYNTDPADTMRVAAAFKKFMEENSNYDITYHQKLYGREEYCLLHVVGYHRHFSDGSKYSVLRYEDVSEAYSTNKADLQDFDHSIQSVIEMETEGTCVISADTHEILLVNSAMKDIVPPQHRYYLGITFEEYFINNTNLDALDFSHLAGKGETIIPNPTNGEDFFVHVSEITWRGIDAYLIKTALKDNKYYDILTGLSNMNYFLSQGSRVVDDIKKSGKDAVLVYYDIRGMKNYNRTYGFHSGDILLIQIASVLKEEFPAPGIISRLSDDHFAILTEEDNIVEHITKIYKKVMAFGQGMTINMNAGICRITPDIHEISTAGDNAKLACNSIKNDLSSFYRFYLPSMRSDNELYFYVVDNIDSAIKNGYIKVYYQPVVRTISGRLCGAEALARWEDPERGLLNPYNFISALEETHQIYKLDCCIIEQIVKDIRYKMNNNEPYVPVSFNLSRLDFITCDIFSTIEAIVAEYDIPRDLINIEITESIMVSTGFIRSEVAKFRDAGYEVWMDDFGSGYSSLNVLKDYAFDELKIDIDFISSFTQRSKDIISSVVDMSKKIGIKTLAEGVETAEQYRFLKHIGCEKIQGFLFGRPLPPGEFEENLAKQSIEFETREWKNYYDAIGRINLMSDSSLALLEYDNNGFKYLFANDSYKNTLREFGFSSLSAGEDDLNNFTAPSGRMYQNFAKHVISCSEPQNIIFNIGERYVNLYAAQISCYNGRYVFKVSLDALNLPMHGDQRDTDSYIRDISMLYNTIYLIHPYDDYVETIMENGSINNLDNAKAISLLGVTEFYARNYVYPEDREDYFIYSDATTLVKRIKNSGKGFISGHFRILDSDTGNYIWKEHTCMAVPRTNGRLLMELIKDFDPKPYGKDYSSEPEEIDFDGISLSYKELWNNLSGNIAFSKYFWKDRNRKYVGVSKPLLDYLGFKEESEIVGKTDDDLHWNVSESDFANAENSVIYSGKKILSEHGQSMVRGKLHNILTTKIPLYKDGRIIGLLGYFTDIDQDEIPAPEDDFHSLSRHDDLSDSMSTYGTLEMLWDYHDALLRSNEDYLAAIVDVPEFKRILETYGKNVGNSLIKLVSERLKSTDPSSVGVGRIYGCRFAIIRKISSVADAEELLSKVNASLENIHTINGFSCTIHPIIGWSLGSAKNTADEVFVNILHSLYSRIKKKLKNIDLFISDSKEPG